MITSAPAKVILFGEHGVNRQQPALATAIDLRLFCRVTTREDDVYTFVADTRRASFTRAELQGFKAKLDAWRNEQAFNEIRQQAQDFFAPTRYVLAHLIEQMRGPGLDIVWRSTLPTGGGLGSGAAASAAMALGAASAMGQVLSPTQVAFLAWQGDIIAHGGVASGLDSGASALGGLIRYTLVDGPQALPSALPLPIVIGDTQVKAATAEVNTRVRTWLAAHPARKHLFCEMGLLAQQAENALANQDLPTLGHLMNLNQLLLEKLGVSVAANERLIEATIDAGALGAKVSGSGGGGIIIALTEPGQQAQVAAAIEAAGGKSLVTTAGCPGARVETSNSWEKA